MFKRKLLKRALPIILSVAMVFDTLPATALAAEYEEVETTEKADLEEIVTDDEDVKANDAETREADVQKENSTVSGPKEDSTPRETEVTDTDDNKTETEVITEDVNATEEVEAEIKAEILAEGEASSQKDAKKTQVVKFVYEDKDFNELRSVADNRYTRILNAEGLAFSIEYLDRETRNYSVFQELITEKITIEIDGEDLTDNLKDKLTYTWVKKGEGEGTTLKNEFPKDAGEYELTISMDPASVDGLYNELESALKVSLTIEKADIKLHFGEVGLNVVPGTTVKDLKDSINKNYTIEYTDSNYTVSRDILDIKDDADKKLPLTIYTIDENGTRQLMADTDKFDKTKDYVMTIDEVSLTANAAKNYKLGIEKSYPITVGNLQETEIKFERKADKMDLTAVYDDAKAWTIEEVTTGIFADDKTAADSTIIKKGAPAVYIQGKDDEEGAYNTLLSDAVVEAKWYTRERVSDAYKVDEDAGEIGDNDYVYKPMVSDPKNAGEYYIIWSYAGDNGAYEESHSDAVRFIINPAPIVIKTNKEKVDAAGFYDGMDEAAVNKALANVSYDVYPFVKDETTGEMKQSDTPMVVEPGFFGVSYRGDVSADESELYYVPEFVLERRVLKVTEKGGEAVEVAEDKRAVAWTKADTLQVVVDDIKSIRSDELPNEVDAANIESVEFEYRVRFTGNKIVYDIDGDVTKEGIPVTNVTTNAADKNYLADTTRKTLDETAVNVELKSMEATRVVVDDIVASFVEENKDLLVPAIAEGADAGTVHQGTWADPAVRVYDGCALFDNRASYKKAKVYGAGENGSDLGVASTDESLTYTWATMSLDAYENYLKKYDESQREYKDFEEYAKENNIRNEFITITDPMDGTLVDYNNDYYKPGLYRLEVTYNDPKHEHESAVGYAYFKVVPQEVLIQPATQYAKDKENIDAFRGRLGKTNGIDYILYQLPHNDIDAFNALDDEAKIGCMYLPDGIEYSVEWEVLRKEKDPATGLDKKEPAVWIKLSENEENFDDEFTYGVVAHWNENGGKAGTARYTTFDSKTEKETGEVKHHELVSEIQFFDQQLYVEVDAEKIQALGHEYNGQPVSLAEAAKALTFYTDEALTESSKLSTEAIVNTTDEYDPSKINIYWEKYDTAAGADDKNDLYVNEDAVYGGTYGLVLFYEGGELGGTAGTQEDSALPIYAPLYVDGQTDGGWTPVNPDEQDCSFKITPRDITITAKTVEADTLTAGETADKLLTREIEVTNLVENDKEFFAYAEIKAGSFAECWNGEIGIGEDGAIAYRKIPVYPYRVNKNGGYPAFNGAATYIIQVNDREIKNPANEYLRFNSRYTVKLTNELASPLAESYKVTYATTEVTVGQRGSAEIGKINDTLSASGITYDLSDSTYTIRPRGSVKFFYDNAPVGVMGRDGYETLKNTNILGFRIYAPREFYNDFATSKENFVYKNAIWNAGGYFRGTTTAACEWNNSSRYIDVVFPLAKDDTARSFNITWEDGYTDTFTLADIVLEEDLTKAVAPKSIAFNGVQTKMAVGETQQLDLKLAKTQLGDVINIRYCIQDGAKITEIDPATAVTKNDSISLDPETGKVIALKAGTAATTIVAYPVYKDADGKFRQIIDAKGKPAKTASTKITVTEVTASTIKKITAQGEEAELLFTVPDDGYRREIYVVDVTKGTAYEGSKKWKPADFNAAIAKINNGQWKEAGFAIAPEYSYAKNDNLDEKAYYGEYDKKAKAHIISVYGLEPEHEYVMYVRNVSAVRELDDGSVIALSANGAVKSFKTTKSQVKELDLDFTIATDEKDKKKNPVTHPVNQEGRILTDEWTVELSAKKAQLNVYGLFSDKAGGNAFADTDDLRRYSLIPTLKEEKDILKKYQLPKLEFAVYDDEGHDWYEAFNPDYMKLYQSKYAAVSNKGSITLKGVDLNGEATVFIYVRDSVQEDVMEIIPLTITAKPASVTGKAVKLKVGQTIRLSDYLEYKDAGKKKIPYYRSCGLTISEEMKAQAKAAGYEIEDVGGSREHDWLITVVSPNKDKFALTVTDYDADGNEMQATVTLTSAEIDPVKGLKVTYVDDKHITINFTHDDGSVYQYLMEVKDARGNIVDTRILDGPKYLNVDGVDAKELKNVQSWIQDDDVSVDGSTNCIIADPDENEQSFVYYTGTKVKAKTFAYTYYSEKLVRLSAYTISVTPLYGNQKALKPATAKTKTTDIPASYKNADLSRNVPDRRGGDTILCVSNPISKTNVSSQVMKGEVIGDEITDYPYRFVSGNTYTLSFEAEDVKGVAKDRVSDTLTWKSSNTKVASVKANPGTYTATLKPVNQGKTTLTVTSKITKKVIARWQITVYAVKDGSSYGGDYEPTWDKGFYEKILALYDPNYEGRLEVLSAGTTLEIKNDGKTWVSFTAPHYGKYTFKNYNKNLDTTFYDGKNGSKVVAHNRNELFLEANQKVYFTVNGNARLDVTIEEFARLLKSHTKETPLEVKAGYVAFTAWEDNVYTVWLNGTKFSGYEAFGMTAGETKYISVSKAGKMYVTYRKVEEQQLTTGNADGVKVTVNWENQERYIGFTVPVDGAYEFTHDAPATDIAVTITKANGNTLTEIGKDAEATAAETPKSVSKSYQLKEGDKIVVAVEAKPEITDAAKKFEVTVKVAAPEREEVKDGTITIAEGTTKIVKYTIAKENCYTDGKARFKLKVKNGEIGTVYNKDYKEVKLENNVLTIDEKAELVKAGEDIYIEVKAADKADDTDVSDNSTDKKAEDAVLTVTKVTVLPLSLTSAAPELIIDNDTEQWYTFTASEDGYYEFGAEVEEGKDENDKKHTVVPAFYYKAFDDETPDAIAMPMPCQMKAGEKIAIKIVPTEEVPDIEKEDGTTEVVTTKVTVSAKKLDVTTIVPNAEKATEVPTIDAGSKDVRYYSFTAAKTDVYTITWTPSDPKADNAEVTYGYTLGNNMNGSATPNVNAGQKYYIKVKVKDAESKNPVKGTLSVKATNLSAIALTEGVDKEYTLDAKDVSPATETYKFTAVESGSYRITLTPYENKTTGLDYAVPSITVDDDILETLEDGTLDTVLFNKGETKYIKLSYASNGNVKETKGTITIASVVEAFAGDTTNVETGDTPVTKEYTYVIPESGRYEIRRDYDCDKVTVNVSMLVDGKSVPSQYGCYFRKNDKVKVVVTVDKREKDADKATVTLYKPSLIKVNPLGDGKIEMPILNRKGNVSEPFYQYYEYSAEETMTYSLQVSDIADGSAAASMYYAVNNNNNWERVDNNPDNVPTSVSMQKGDKLIIRMYPNSQKTVKFTLNVIANQSLALGENTVTLAAHETKNLTYRALEKGYYRFSVEKNANLLFKGEAVGEYNYTQTGSIPAAKSETYTLKNNSDSAVTVKVTMASVTPVELKPGEKAENIKIGVDEEAYFVLKTFKNAEYIINVTDTNKGEDLALKLNGNAVNNSKKTADGLRIVRTISNGSESLFVIKNIGAAETTATVELAISEVEPMTGEVTYDLGKNDSKKFSFVATQDARYLVSMEKANKDAKNITLTQDTSNTQAIDSKHSIALTRINDLYSEVILKKGDKIAFNLSYNPEDNDKKANDSEKVTVKIAPIKPTAITAESTNVTIEKNDSTSVWYELQNAGTEGAAYKFTVTDEYDNELLSKTTAIYSYMTQVTPKVVSTPISKAEIYVAAGKKVFVNVNYGAEGTYKLKYETTPDEAILEGTGTKVLDFEYGGEVQILKFVVKEGGTYKISKTDIRGAFAISAMIGENSISSNPTPFLQADDIVTIKVTATSVTTNKASVSIRISAVDKAEALTWTDGKAERTEDIEADETRYLETRVPEDGLYMITASGEPTITYARERKSDSNGINEPLNGTVYEELKKDERLTFKVAGMNSGDAKRFSLKIEKITLNELSTTEDKPLGLTAVTDTYYEMTGEKEYVKFTVPADGDYMVTVTAWNVTPGFGAAIPAQTAAAQTLVQDIVTSSRLYNGVVKDDTILITFTKSSTLDKEDSAWFRLVIEQVKEKDSKKDITLNSPDSAELGADETMTYKFKAPEAGDYVVEFTGSNCTVDPTELSGMEKDEERTITVSTSNANKAGFYTIEVKKYELEEIKLNEAKTGNLKKGETKDFIFKPTTVGDDGTTYQIYIGGKGANLYVDGDYVNENKEFTIKKDGDTIGTAKISVESDETVKNASYTVMIKEVVYSAIQVGTPATGTLDAHEKKYYEFNATADAKYLISCEDDNVDVYSVRVADVTKDADGKDVVGYFNRLDSDDEGRYTVKKDQRIRIVIKNISSNKSAGYTLTLEEAAAAPKVEYTAIGVDETKTGKLSSEQSAIGVGFEFTASAADEKKGTTYSIQFSKGTTCTYQQTREVEDPDDATKKITDTIDSGTLGANSEKGRVVELTCLKGDKIKLKVTGTARYQLTIKEVKYETLELGKLVENELTSGQTAYYQFTAPAPAEGETTTTYQVYGIDNDTNSSYWYDYEITTPPATEDGEASVKSNSQTVGGTHSLAKDAVLRIKVTGSLDYKLAIKKVEYKDLTLGQTETGNLKYNERNYYKFTAGAPAEGETTTKYQVYGKNYNGASTFSLADKGTKMFSMSGEYSLTVVKYEEKPITIGKTETVSLAAGQEIVYAYKYDGDTPKAFTVVTKKNHTDDSVGADVYYNDGYVGDTDRQKIDMSKDDVLKITVRAGNEAVENFTFTVSEFKPEELKPGELTAARVISEGETVYYQYPVPENGDGDYFLVALADDNKAVQFTCTKSGSSITKDSVWKLVKDDVLLVKVSNPKSDGKEGGKHSFRLNLQKVTEDKKDMTTLPWNGTLQPGEVKYFKYELSEADKTNKTEYIYSTVVSENNVLKYKTIGYDDDGKYTGTQTMSDGTFAYSVSTDDLTVLVYNPSMYKSVELNYKIQKKEAIEIGKTYEGTLEPNECVYYTFPGWKVMTKDADGNDVEQRADYYKSLSGNRDAITFNTSSGMNSNENAYVVRIKNTGEQTEAYKFELRDVWKTKVTAASNTKYSLEAGESAYLTVEAPENKTLFVSVDSKADVNVYCGTDKDSINTDLGANTLYRVSGTSYFRVDLGAGTEQADITLNVTDAETIDLSEDKLLSVSTFVEAGAKETYEFNVLKDGIYTINVSGNVAECKYKTNADGEEKTYYNGSAIELAAGTKLSLSIETAAARAATEFITVEVKYNAIPFEEEVSGSSEFLFVIPKDGYYEFYSSSVNGNSVNPYATLVDVETETQLDYGNIGSGSSIRRRLTAGQTVCLIIYSENSRYSVHMNELYVQKYTVTSLPYGREVTGETEFTFTATEAGAYIFYATNTDTKGVTVKLYDNEGQQKNVNINSYDKTLFYIECNMEEGETVRLAAGPYSSADTGFYSVHVKKAVETYEAEVLPYDKEVNGRTQFTFTAPEDGTYAFSSSYTASNTEVRAILYDGTGNSVLANGGYNDNFYIRHEMNAGDTVILNVRPSDTYNMGSYMVYINKVNVQSYLVNSLPYEMRVSGDTEFTFTPEESREYVFYVTSTESNANIRADLYDGAGNRLDYDYNNFYITYYLTEGDTYKLVIRPYSGGDTGTYTIHVIKAVETYEVYGTPYDKEVSGRTEFMFTAKESGTYTFYSTYSASNTTVYAYLYDEDGIRLTTSGNNNNGNFSIRYEMYEDQTVVLKAYPNNISDSGSYMVHIDKVDVQSYPVSYLPYEKNVSGDAEFTFTAEESMEYVFYSTNIANGTYVHVDLYNETAGWHNSGTYNGDFTIGQDIDEGDRVRLVVGKDNLGDSESYTVHIKKAVETYEVKKLPYEMEVSGKAEFMFTAKESGAYVFCSTYTDSNTQACAYLYDEDGKELAYSNKNGNFYIRHEMDAGATVKLAAQPTNSNNTGSYLVHINELNVQKYTVDSVPYEMEVSGDAEFMFTAEESGAYVFYSTDTESGTAVLADLYDEEGKWLDDSSYQGNFSINHSLDAYETVRLAVRPYNLDDTGSYAIHIEKINEEDYRVGQLPYEKTVRGTISFIFTVPESGDYVFYSSYVDSVDTIAYLYDYETNNQLYYNDDAGENFNFLIRCRLVKDQIIRLDTSAIGTSNNGGSYCVHVNKVNVQRYEVDSVPYTSNEVSGETEFTFTAKESGTYRFYTESDISIRAYLYDEARTNGYDIDHYNGSAKPIEHEMGAGDTVKFLVGPYNLGGAGSYTIHVDRY